MGGSGKLTAALVVVLLFATIQCVQPAVFSVDLGSEWIKVAVVDIRAGQSPINIALNEMSKRKSPALVAFSGGSRMLAEEALSISAKYPDKVYARLRDMVGKPAESVREIASSSYLKYDFVETNGTLGIRVDGGEVYRSVELLAMILGYCRSLAEASARAEVKDAVITVPPYFGQSERKAVQAAAQAAGINVLSLMNEHAAAALQYGIDKDFTNATTKRVLFYDMGANSAYAAVVYFSAYTTKQVVKEFLVNYLEMKGVRWDPEVGGQAMEMRLVEHFAKDFEKKTGVDVRSIPRAMAKMKKQAKRTKEVLSANAEATFFVDSLHDDQDFKSKITREEFEKLCEDIWERAVVPLKVLEDVGITAEQLDAVELLGGATRVPKLQQVLTKALGGKVVLERHLDSDEAIAMGAALHAANLTEGIRLRRFGMVDGITYGVVMSVSTPDGTYQEVLVPRLKRLPLKLARPVKQQTDFDVSLAYDPEGELPPGHKQGGISAFHISGMTEAVSKYSSYNLTAPIRAVLHFALSRSGVVSLDRAEAVVEFSEWVEVPAKNSTTANVTKNSTTANVTKNSTTANVTIPTENGNATAEAERKLRKRTIRAPLQAQVTSDFWAVPEEEVAEFKQRLRKLKQADEEKRQLEERKNSLESYIYTTKDMLEAMEREVARVTTEQQRRLFVEKLEEAAEWLYSEGETSAVSSSGFKQRLEELKALGDPIFYRVEQMQARPEAVREARQYLLKAEEMTEEWKSSKPWALKSGKVREELSSLAKWLDDKEAEQRKLADHEEPAFSSSAVRSRLDEVINAVTSASLMQKPPTKPAKNETEEANRSTKEEGERSTQEGERSAQEGERSTQEGERSTHEEQRSAAGQNSSSAKVDEEVIQGGEAPRDEL